MVDEKNLHVDSPGWGIGNSSSEQLTAREPPSAV
jgi:hypothetical protein